uniref:Uncharacterized protein n=1 Tax=Tanacetum cinerariifolium TaxID=118510 RepID=A0A6L2N570_TANCI|nr:hypothetical protein [Tanacetum cinerariifolium]
MAESSAQNPSSPNITPKEELDTQERPKSLHPFLLTHQVEFTFDEITFSTNNEVALLYPSHPKTEYFETVLDFISKCCLKEAFTRAPNQFVKYLAEFWYTAKTLEESKIWDSTPTRGIRGEIWVNTIRNAIRTNYPNEYVASPSLTIVRPWFSLIGYNGEIRAKGILKKSCLPPRWRLLMAKIIECLGGMDERTQNYLPNRVFARTNLSVLVDTTKSVGDGLKISHTDLGTNEESISDEILKKRKLEDLSNLMQDIRATFFSLDSVEAEPIIISDESEKEETERYKDTHATSHDEPKDTSVLHPPSSKSVQL